MTSTPAAFDAGRPRLSGPIRRIARPLGPIARPLAGSRWFPLWAILGHTGRTSGKPYATPVVAFRTPDGFLIPLPFGDATQWAKNVFAARGGSLRFAGHDHRLVDPRVIDRDAAAPYVPALGRFLGRRLGIRQYVRVERVPVVLAR
jgi:deazaflavin-dependent oxidoreductase (nitroreductase family)